MGSNPQYASMYHLRRLMPSANGGDFTKGDDNSLILLDTYVKFGRSESNDVQLTSCHGTKAVNSTTNMISREHAYISGKKSASGRIEKYELTDQSLNGTYINDFRCRANHSDQINEGDIIKFGHMNGASIKEGTNAPQANAEFAFLVEKASQDKKYLGFANGVRTNSLLCTGDDINARELPRKSSNAIHNAPAVHPPHPYLPHTVGIQLPTTTTSCSTATTANMMSLALFPWLNVPLYSQQCYPPLHAGFRPPNVGSPFQQMSFPPTLQPNLLQRNLFEAQVSQQQQQQQLFNQLLTSTAGSAAMGIVTSEALASAAASSALINAARVAEEAQMVQQQHQPTHQETQQKAPLVSEKIPVQMECDSSVPSPPKVHIASTMSITPQLASPNKSEEINSYKSMESPTLRRQTVVAANPWDSTPSPKQRDTPDTGSLKDHDDNNETNRDETDTESRPEEIRKQPATSTSSTKGEKVGKKNNECARLLDYSTSVLPSFKGRRTSTSRRLTDEERYEKNAKKEQKRKEKAAASSSKDTKSRLKQLSSEDSLSSDDDSEDLPVPPKKEPVKRKRTPPSESEPDVDSDDSSKKKKNNKKKGRKPSMTPKQMTPKMKWKTRKERDSSPEESEEDEEPDRTQMVVAGKEEPCKMKKCEYGGKVLTFTAEWVQCDDCDGWFHNHCALGHNKPFTGDKFFCGCRRKDFEAMELAERRRIKAAKASGRKAKK